MRHRASLTLSIAILAAAAPALPAPPPAGGATAWPGLRGPTHDGAVRDARLFADEREGTEAGLGVAWKVPLGPGYPVPVTDGERVITAFQSGDSDVVAAFDPASGDELWRVPLGEAHAGHTGSHDGPIATPALAGGRVFALGPRGDLVALDAASGETLWRRHLVADLQSEPPYYGFATSPLVAGEVLVVEIGAGPGRTVGGLAVDSGRLLWSAGDDTVRYHSPVLVEIGGRRQVVAPGNRTLTGLDPASGEVLWSYEHAGDDRDMGGNTIVPVPAGEGRILLLNRHPESVMLRIEASGSAGYEVTELWTSTSIKSTYILPVYHDGYLYGMNSKIFTCVDAASGEMVWRSREPGDGLPTLVGDHLVVMEKAGVLRVAEASPEGYHELARLDLFDEVAWSAPAYAGGHLWARSMGHLARVDPLRIDRSRPAGAESRDRRSLRGAFGRFLAEVDAAADKAAEVDAFLAAQPSFPLIEEDGTVRFLYRGEAEDVGIVGDMIGFRREDPMTRVEGTDLFYYSARLEPDAAVTYGFLIDFGEPSPDPLNPHPASGVFGEVSFLAMPARRTPGYLAGGEPARRGRMEEIEWESEVREGQTRRARVYLPAGYGEGGDREDARRYPTVYVMNGAEALEEGAMGAALDHLLGDTVEPLIAVFVLPDPERPRPDLGDTAGYAEMVTGELIPLVDARYRTLDDPLDRAAVGSAGGGDVALTAVLHHPDHFARAGLLWPTLFPEPPDVPPGADPLVLHLTWGAYHVRSPHENFDAAVANRELWQALRAAGHRPTGGEVPEGFGWAFWRAHTGEMLRDLFPER